MRKPRLGFLGVGWIGRNRLEAVVRAGGATIAAVADPSIERRLAALEHAPEAVACEHLGHLLELNLDAIVIATPSALHADHAVAALERGHAVFCQKPLARTAVESRRVVDAARVADRLLDVDLSYRHTEAMRAIRALVRTGGLGKVFAAQLTFHNAYGPDAAWFYDKARSGGGCVIDLGVHLVDLALWLLDFPAVIGVDSQLFAGGRALPVDSTEVEDYAAVQLELAGGVAVQLACSWRASAGRAAVIEAAVYGTDGGAAMRNVEGSFYDFVGERFRGQTSERLVAPPDPWGGRAIVAWCERLGRGARFDPEAERLVDLAAVLDTIYLQPGAQTR